MVSAKIIELTEAHKKPLRVPMDQARPLLLIKRLAPQSVIDKMLGGLVDSNH